MTKDKNDNIPQETKTLTQQTIEQSVAQSISFLGTLDKDLIKMFSILTKDGVRKKTMMLGDCDAYKHCSRLKYYAFQDLFLNVSESGTGRNQMVDIAKVPFQMENQQERKSILDRLFKFG